MKHNDHVEYLKLHPHKIGINGVIWAASHVLYSPRGIVTTEIDLLYKTLEDYIAVEFKSSTKRRDRAREQLSKAEEFVRKELGDTCIKLFCYYKNREYFTERI